MLWNSVADHRRMDELLGRREHGVFLRREALDLGYNDRDLRRALRDQVLVRVRHGAYASASAWHASNATARHVMSAHAVALSHRSAALSHVSGAALHGLGLWRSDLSRVHVTRVGATSGRKQQDVAYHDGPAFKPLAQIAGSSVLPMLDCALGAAAMSSIESGVVLVDSAYNLGGFSEDEVRGVYEEMRGWPGTARLQITLRLATRGAESVGESRARYLFWANRLPRPVLQYVVRDGDKVAGVTDFAWPEYGLFGEFDGRIKYGRLLRPDEEPEDAVYREKVREDRLRELTGWRMIRLSWQDLAVPQRTAARVQNALGARAA